MLDVLCWQLCCVPRKACADTAMCTPPRSACCIKANSVASRVCYMYAPVASHTHLCLLPQVGTLAAAGYKQVLEVLRAAAKAAGKQTYTMLVGKPNPAKLANFPEVEVWVMVGGTELAWPEMLRCACRLVLDCRAVCCILSGRMCSPTHDMQRAGAATVTVTELVLRAAVAGCCCLACCACINQQHHTPCWRSCAPSPLSCNP